MRLDQRKNEVRALGQVLATADQDVASKALQAAMNLTPIDVCKDVASLTAVVPEPTESAKVAELRGLRVALASARENLEAGRFIAAQEQALALLPRARELHYSPALAEALTLAGDAQVHAGGSREEPIALGVQAFLEADAGRSDTARAEVATKAALWFSESGHHAEAEQWLSLAQGALDRIDERGSLRAEWLRIKGCVKRQQGKNEDAAQFGRQALDVALAAHLSPRMLVSIDMSLAMAEALLGRDAEAERASVDAEEIALRAMGPDNPVHISLMISHSFVATARNDPRGTLEHSRRALELAERIAPKSEYPAVAYTNACGALDELGDFETALDYCRRALDLVRARYGPDSLNLGIVLENLSAALIGLRRHAEAVPYLDEAVRLFDKANTWGDQDLTARAYWLVAMTAIGSPGRAVSSVEKAVSAATTRPALSTQREQQVADARFALAKAYFAMGERGARIAELCRAAEDALRRQKRDADAREVVEWRRSHLR